MFGSSFILFVIQGFHVLILFICIHLRIYWCPTQFPYQMMLVLFNSNVTGVTSETGTADPSGAPSSYYGFAQSLVSCVLFCRSVFVLFSLLAIALSVIN